jgi:hypothetical protein
MATDVEVVTPTPAVDPREARRRSVLTLRLRRMSEVQIARVLGVNQATISRDIQWIRTHWGDVFGQAPSLKPEEEIGEAVAIYEDAEQAALLEYHALAQTTAPIPTKSRARMLCLETAMRARERRIDLLQDLGFLERKLGSVSLTIARADELRSALRAQGFLGQKTIETTAVVEEGDVDPIQRWLTEGS